MTGSGCVLFQDPYPMKGLQKTTEAVGAKTFGTLHSAPCVNRPEREADCLYLLVLGSTKHGAFRLRHRCFVPKNGAILLGYSRNCENIVTPKCSLPPSKNLPLGPNLSHNIQSTSYYRSPLISTLILSSHQTLGLPNASLLWPFLLFLFPMHATCSVHLILLYLITR